MESTNGGVIHTVPKPWGCPGCGERRMDYLLVHDDDSIECYTCKRVYNLPEPHQHTASCFGDTGRTICGDGE